MKKINILIFTILISLLSTGCFEDYDQRNYFRTLTVEFHDASTRTPAPGLDYPLLPALRNNAGLRQFRVNLFGGLHDQDLDIPVRIISESTTAIEGVHFNLPNALNVRIPAGEAFGTLDINIPVLDNVSAVRLVLELQATTLINASNNHKRIGMDIRR